MTKSKKPIDPVDEAPEADAAWFARAQPASAVLPGLFGEAAAAQLLQPRRGRPRSSTPKVHVNMRLDAEVLDAFKRTGPGWQTRVNQALRDWLTAKP